MDTKKKATEQTEISGETSDKPLQVNDETLKDLAAESRTAQRVKGGIPKQPDSRTTPR